MNDPKSSKLTDAVREALAKKHEAARPTVKTKTTKTKQNPACYLCGNPRKTHKDKLTAQEKKLFQDLDSLNHHHSNGNNNENYSQ